MRRWFTPFFLMFGCGQTVPAAPACTDDPSRLPPAGELIAVGDIRIGGRSWMAVEVQSQPFPVLAIVLTESPDACVELNSSASTEQRFFFMELAGTVGSYPIAPKVDATHADAFVEHGCSENSEPPDTEISAVSGTVRLDVHVQGVRAAGHYDLTFSTGDHLVGDFDTCVCSSQKSCSTPAKP